MQIQYCAYCTTKYILHQKVYCILQIICNSECHQIILQIHVLYTASEAEKLLVQFIYYSACKTTPTYILVNYMSPSTNRLSRSTQYAVYFALQSHQLWFLSQRLNSEWMTITILECMAWPYTCYQTSRIENTAMKLCFLLNQQVFENFQSYFCLYNW